MDPGRQVNSDPRRALPSVDRLMRDLQREEPELPRWAIAEGARRAVARARESLALGAEVVSSPGCGQKRVDTGVASADWQPLALAEAKRLARGGPPRVINATGIVLHTNLGRAPLAAGAAQAAAAAGRWPSALEFDLEQGRRGNRLASVEEKLRILGGAEAAYACNNNAAAMLLALSSLAAGREVLVSRGELVEIGGSFRVPEIMQRAGVRLVEVGSTNRTHRRDYERAIGPDTALLLKVHRSNFELRGFVKEVGLADLAEIGRRHAIPVVEDLGSGTLVDLRAAGFPEQSYAVERLRLGADIVCFSGDKLLGGPQAGIVLGAGEAISRMRSNPLARALRLDKMTLAALDWTLARLLDGSASRELPVLRQLLRPISELEQRTRALAERLREQLAPADTTEVGVERGRVPVGGGSLPGFEIESCWLRLRSAAGARELTARLRAAEPPVLARVRDEAVLIDLRAVETDDLAALERVLLAVSKGS